MIANVISPEILELVENRNWDVLKQVLPTLEPVDISELISRIPSVHDRVLVFRLIPKDLAADTFSEMTWDFQEELVSALTSNQIKQVLSELDPDDRTHFFEETPPEVTRKLLDLLSPQDRKETMELLGYPDQSVGRLMTPDYIAIKKEWTISQAIEHIRKIGKIIENFDIVYVIDNKWKLMDSIVLKDLILAEGNAKVESLMEGNYINLSVFDDQEKAVHVMDHYNLSILPVVDSSGILLGIVTFDDVFDVSREEATEDIHKSASVAPLETSYPSTSVWTLYAKRVGWLVALVFVNLVSGWALSRFEGLIQQVTALVFFLPLIIDSSGNAGSQSATLIVRAMAMHEVDPKHWWRLVLKDLAVSLCLGLTMGLAVSVVGFVRGGLLMAVSVSIAMISVVVMGSLLGTVLPFILRLLKLDPATASAPLITSLADILGVIIFFSISSAIIGI